MLKKVSNKLFKLVLSFIGRIIIEKIDFEKSPKNGQKVKGLTTSILQCSILNEEPCKWASQIKPLLLLLLLLLTLLMHNIQSILDIRY